MIQINLEEKDYYDIISNSWEKDFKLFSPDTKINTLPISRLMYYRGNYITFEHSPDEDVTDSVYFLRLLNTPDAIKYSKKHYYVTEEPSKLPSNQIHAMYSTWLDHKIHASVNSQIHVDLSFHKVSQYIKQGKVLMTTGLYTGPFGNTVATTNCIVGYDDVHKLLLLADPLGDFHSNYEDRNGYLVTMTEREFVTHVQPVWYFNKYVHVPKT